MNNGGCALVREPVHSVRYGGELVAVDFDVHQISHTGMTDPIMTGQWAYWVRNLNGRE